MSAQKETQKSSNLKISPGNTRPSASSGLLVAVGNGIENAAEVVYRSLPPNARRVVDDWLEGDGHYQVLSTVEIVGKYLEAKKQKLRPASITTYGAVLYPFARANSEVPTTPEPIEAYLAPFSNENTTARHKYNVLRAFYNWLSRRGLISTNPMTMVDRPAGQADEIVPLNAEQNQVLHDFPKTDREQGYIGLMLDHGFRLSEVTRLNVGDIYNDRVYVHGKERKEFFPLLGEVREWLLKLAGGRALDEPLFVGRQGRLSDSQVQLGIKHLLERAGVNGVRASPHTLRHTFSTLAYLAGCDWDAVELLLRQKEKRRGVTNRYIHLSPEQRLKLVREKLERYSPLRLLAKAELGEKPDFHQLGLRHTGTVPLIEGEPAELLIHLLDQMEVLGETARQIKFQLGGNGHKAELLQYITEELKHQVNK
ncbi:Tyrosine recombinase XerC [subsurface metagenome]